MVNPMTKPLTPNPPGITIEQATEYCNRVISGWKSAIRDAPFRTPSYEEHDKFYAPILESLRLEVEANDEFRKKYGYYPWAQKPKWVKDREKAAQEVQKQQAKAKPKSGGKVAAKKSPGDTGYNASGGWLKAKKGEEKGKVGGSKVRSGKT